MPISTNCGGINTLCFCAFVSFICNKYHSPKWLQCTWKLSWTTTISVHLKQTLRKWVPCSQLQKLIIYFLQEIQFTTWPAQVNHQEMLWPFPLTCRQFRTIASGLKSKYCQHDSYLYSVVICWLKYEFQTLRSFPFEKFICNNGRLPVSNGSEA